MDKEKSEQLVWVLHNNTTDLFFCVADSREVAEEMKSRLYDDDLSLQITPVRLIDKLPNKIFVGVILNRELGVEEGINYWFSDCPYEEDYILVDDDYFEVGVKCHSVAEALDIAFTQWKAHKPEDRRWTTGRLSFH